MLRIFRLSYSLQTVMLISLWKLIKAVKTRKLLAHEKNFFVEDFFSDASKPTVFLFKFVVKIFD